MAIILDVPADTNLDDFDGLREAVVAWIEREDLFDRVPDFIRLAEARFRREITATEQEVTIALPGPLPDDFDSVRLVFLADAPTVALTQVSPAELRQNYAGPGTGRPQVFAITAGHIIIGPHDSSSHDAFLTYNRKIPSLTNSNQTNWLLLEHPDLYLFGTILQAEFYNWNDERLPLLKTAVDEAIIEINMAENRRRYGQGPIVMMPPVSEYAKGAYRR